MPPKTGPAPMPPKTGASGASARTPTSGGTTKAGGATKGGASKGGASKGGASKGGASKGGATKGGARAPLPGSMAEKRLKEEEKKKAADEAAKLAAEVAEREKQEAFVKAREEKRMQLANSHADQVRQRREEELQIQLQRNQLRVSPLPCAVLCWARAWRRREIRSHPLSLTLFLHDTAVQRLAPVVFALLTPL